MKQDDDLLCHDPIEAFVWKNQPYVYEKEQGQVYKYRQFHYDIDVTDERGLAGKCGVAEEDVMMFCESSISDYVHKGQEWEFKTRTNGFLEYLRSEYTVNDLLNNQSTRCTKEGDYMLHCKDYIGVIAILDDQRYLFHYDPKNKGVSKYRLAW